MHKKHSYFDLFPDNWVQLIFPPMRKSGHDYKNNAQVLDGSKAKMRLTNTTSA